MVSFKQLLDLSDYPVTHFLHDKSNKKVSLKMTDELKGKVLTGIVCLRSKLYSIQLQGGVKQSAKGVQKTVKKTLRHDLFKSCLFDNQLVRKSMAQLKSENNQPFYLDRFLLLNVSNRSYLLQSHLDGRLMNPIVSQGSRLSCLQMKLPSPRLPNLTMIMSLSLLYILFYTLSWN